MKFELLKGGYGSPRISGEVPDCSMPCSFDQFNNCGYNCQYCFSTYQRGCNSRAEDYFAKKYKRVSLKHFKNYFTDLDNPKNPFAGYIKNKLTMQWGGLSDPFCPIEEQDGTGYEILKFMKDIQYPINFSSKSDLLIRNKKYLDLFKGMEKLWSYKASIITLDTKKSAIIEAGTPTPQQRVKVLETLGKMGIWTIWRLRPFIIGLTSLDYEKQLKVAGNIGVKAISTEFFCLELRSMGIAKAKYDIMSKVIGFDIVQYYKNISIGNGYLRLNRSVKEPYYKRMKELCDKYGIAMHVSDPHGKEYTASGSCCGLPDDKNGKPCLTNYSQFQFTNAMKIAKKNGTVTWDDIAQHDTFLKGLSCTKAPGFNTGGNYIREKRYQMDLYTFLRNLWNNPKAANSPYRYFQGILKPVKLDKNKNIIYKYVPYEK